MSSSEKSEHFTMNPTITCNGKRVNLIDCTFDSAKRHLLIHIPQTCPECDAPVERKTNVDGTPSAVIYCVNPDCPAQTAGKIRRFAKSRDILGLGDSVIVGLLDGMAITGVQDLFALEPHHIEDVLINQEKGIRLGKKRAEAICAEIKEKTQEMTLAEFLGAFGTRGLGVRRATLMSTANPDLNDLERWFDGSLTKPEFAAQAGVPQLGRIIFDDLKKCEAVIRATLKHTTIKEPKPEEPMNNDKLTICITGKLPSGKKKNDYAGPLAAKGHVLTDTLSKEVNVLVMADPNGPESSKTKKAKGWGIALQDEAWLENLTA
jgi:NAD-dependent DNA ligase